MANRFARKTGNWNAADVWSDTPTGTAGAQFIPVSGDVAMANSFTVTINVNATCSEIRNDTTGGATGSGYFILGADVTLTANLINYNATLLAHTAAAPSSAYIVGTLTAGLTNALVSHTGTGTLNIVGNLVGTSTGLVLSSTAGTVNITGNVSSTSSFGIQYDASSVCTVTGNVTAGTATNAYGIRNRYAPGTITVNGNVTGGSGTNCIGVYNYETGVVNVSGNVTGGTGSFANGLSGFNTGTTTVLGLVIGNNYPNGGVVNPCAGLYVVGNGTAKIGGTKTGTGGVVAIDGPIDKRRVFFATGGVQAAYLYDANEGSLVSLSNVDADHPAVTDVRSGVSYYQGSRTGTCVIPPAAAVGVGVPVDHTVGQAALTPADIAAVVGPIWSAG